MRLYTQEQIDRANEVDLADYLQRRGEQLIREGKEYRWEAHDSVSINHNRWFRFSNDTGGYPIKFLTEFYELSFQEAVKELIGEEPAGEDETKGGYKNSDVWNVNEKSEEVSGVQDEGSTGSRPIPTPVVEEAVGTSEEKSVDQSSSAEAVPGREAGLKLPDKNGDEENVIRYLEMERGIERSVIEHFIEAGKLYEEKENHYPVFVGMDANEIPRFAHIRSTKGRIRVDVKGSDKRYGFSHTGNSEELFVFEAAIDLLSFVSIYFKEWEQHHYVSLGGVSEKAMKYYLERHDEIKKVMLCLDDDQAGNDGCRKLLEHIPENCEVIRYVPADKDWNDVLCRKRCGQDIKACKSMEILRESTKSEVGKTFGKASAENISSLVPVICMEQVESIDVEWLWYPFIPFGKLTIIQGDPGLGKTWLAMTIAAACTNRQELPNMLPLEPFNVLYQTAEDGYGDTIKPRLTACGADLKRIFHIIEDEEDLTMIDERLERAIRENNVRLVILDPLQAYIGANININQSNETRVVFKKVNQVAEKTGCAIVVIGHLNKNNGSQSSYRGLGSIDIYAAARSVLLVGRVKKDNDLRVVVQMKDSLAPAESPVAFSLKEGKVTWVGEYEITADQLMMGNEGIKKETKLDMAIRIIREKLSERKAMQVAELNKILEHRGISQRTGNDARTKMEAELEYKWEGKNKVVMLKSSKA